MGMSEFYGAADARTPPKRSRRSIARSTSASAFLDTADMYGPFTNEELVGSRDRRSTRRGRARHQVRQHARAERRAPRHQRPTRVRAPGVRGLARCGSASTRSICTTSIASTRTCRSRTPSARWPTSSPQARCASSACPRPRPRRSERALEVHRDPRAADRVLAVVARSGGRAAAAAARSSASAFVPYSPLGRGFLTGRFQLDRRSSRAGDFRRNNPRFPGDNFQKNLDVVAQGRARSRRRRAARRRSSRSRGCSRRATSSCRFPGRRDASGSRRTPGRSTSCSTRDDLARIEAVAPVGFAAGTRYDDAGMRAVNR